MSILSKICTENRKRKTIENKMPIEIQQTAENIREYKDSEYEKRIFNEQMEMYLKKMYENKDENIYLRGWKYESKSTGAKFLNEYNQVIVYLTNGESKSVRVSSYDVNGRNYKKEHHSEYIKDERVQDSDELVPFIQIDAGGIAEIIDIDENESADAPLSCDDAVISTSGKTVLYDSKKDTWFDGGL